MRLRGEHLRETVAVLWPGPARPLVLARPTRPRHADGAVREYIVVPNAVRPRLLVPERPRRVAAAAVRRYTAPGSRLARTRLRALSLLLACGAGGHLLRSRVVVLPDPDGDGSADTIETYLGEVLGRGDLSVSVHIGPARANRKPVLQVLEPSGHTVAFVKVGVNDLTRRLVRAEAESLRFLASAGLRGVAVPAVLNHGAWRGHEVLVQRALPTWERGPTTRRVLVSAMCELAAVRGTTTAPLTQGGYWRHLRDGVAALVDATNRESLLGVLEHLERAPAADALAWGSWHGDLTPWNVAERKGRLMVWDWERFAHGVPLGFDALHFDLQEAVTRGGVGPQVAVRETTERAPQLLRPFGVDERSAGLVASLYLVEIALRYLHDGQAEAGARLGRIGQWLLPVLVEQARALHDHAPS